MCPILCDPMDCSPLGSTVHGIFQARILEWVAISYSKGSSSPRELNPSLLHLLLWQVDSLLLSHLGSPKEQCMHHQIGLTTYIQTWTVQESPLLEAIWSPNWESVSGGMCTPQVRLQIAVLRVPAYNPSPQIDIVIHLCTKMKLWFNFYDVVCFTLWVIRLLRPWGVGQTSKGSRIPRLIPFLI